MIIALLIFIILAVLFPQALRFALLLLLLAAIYGIAHV